MQTKLLLTRFGSIFGALRFDEKSFFNTLLEFTPFWDYKATNAFHADSFGVHINEKRLNLSTRNKIHLKCHVLDSSSQNGLRHPKLFNFVLDEKPGFKVFCSPETDFLKKNIESVLNTITFFRRR